MNHNVKKFFRIWFQNMGIIITILLVAAVVMGMLIVPLEVGTNHGGHWTAIIYAAYLIVGCALHAQMKVDDG